MHVAADQLEYSGADIMKILVYSRKKLLGLFEFWRFLVRESFLFLQSSGAIDGGTGLLSLFSEVLVLLAESLDLSNYF